MNKDLLTAIGTAIISVLVAYFISNSIAPSLFPIEEVKYKVVNTTIETDLTEPSNEVFNYRAINPTVEVYVGECTQYDEYGECMDERPGENS